MSPMAARPRAEGHGIRPALIGTVLGSTLLGSILLGLALSAGPALGDGPTADASSSEDPAVPPPVAWSFDGPFGRYDPAQLRRGYQVYKQVCSNCHAMKFVAFRALAGIGYDAGQVKAIAASYQVDGGTGDQGEPVKRLGRPSDAFPSSFPSEAAAVAAFGVAPPDMSSLALARGSARPFPWSLLEFLTGRGEAAGPDYIHAVLNGYTRDDDPNANIYVRGHHIAMPKPLSDGQVTGAGGRPRTLAQSSTDVAAFLMWAADPTLDERKALGVRATGFLLVFATLLYFVKRRIWARVGGDVVVGAR